MMNYKKIFLFFIFVFAPTLFASHELDMTNKKTGTINWSVSYDTANDVHNMMIAAHHQAEIYRAREIEKAQSEAKHAVLRAKIDAEVVKSHLAISTAVLELEDKISFDQFGEETLKEKVTRRHSEIEELKEVAARFNSSKDYEFTTAPTSTFGEKLLDGLLHRNKAAASLSEDQKQYRTRTHLIDGADNSLALADAYYQSGDGDAGNFAVEVAKVFADLATSLTPGVSWGRDLYEAYIGLDLIDKHDLSTFERCNAIFGVVTLGTGSKVASGFKILKGLASKVIFNKASYTKVIRRAELIETSAGTVRSRMTNVSEAMPGTMIPKHFNLSVDGENFHVHPNATKHMGEFIRSRPATHNSPLHNDLTLASFEASVKESVATGTWKTSASSNSPIIQGGWELIFSHPRTEGALPVIKHALFKKG